MAIEHLLDEQRKEFRGKLKAYNARAKIESAEWPVSSNAFALTEFQVVGTENGAYAVRVVFNPNTRSPTTGVGVVAPSC